MKDALLKLNKKKSLSVQEMTRAMEHLMSGKASEAEIEEFLLSLREKGETAQEIAAAARVMRKYSLKLSKNYLELLDTCGTGGDAQNTINISTLAALTAAAAGVAVGKHGNRSVSSQCGSADLLEMLGIPIDLPVPAIEACIEKEGFGFFFAPKFHEAIRFAMPARKKIKGKTLFNLLGPLSNPAGAVYQLMGVYDEKWVKIMAETLLELGSKKALVVHGRDGLDEITICEETLIAEVGDGKIKTYRLSPETMGLKKAELSQIQCRSKEECKDAAIQILKGEDSPRADVVALNAGAGLFVAGKASTIKEGVSVAKGVLQSGKVYKKTKAIAGFKSKSTAVK